MKIPRATTATLASVIGTLLFALVVATTTHAQDNRLTITDDEHTLSLTIPEQWQSVVAPPDERYGFMTNRGTAAARVPTDIQIIFRHVDDLVDVVAAPIDLDADNPALDYLTQYAAWRVSRDDGAYSDPVPLLDADGDPIGAIILYVEGLDSPRMGPDVEEALSLGLALYLGDGNLAIVLAEAPAESGRRILPTWTDVFQSVQLDDESPAFAEDIPMLIENFTPPEQLLAEYRLLKETVAASVNATPSTVQIRIPQENDLLALRLANNFLFFPLFEGWQAEREDEATHAEMLLESDDQQAQITLTLRYQPAGYQSPAIELQRQLEGEEDTVLAAPIVPFQWGEFPAAVASVSSEASQQAGRFIIVELPNRTGLLLLRFVATEEASDELVLDWRNLITSLQLNEIRLDVDAALDALFAVQED